MAHQQSALDELASCRTRGRLSIAAAQADRIGWVPDSCHLGSEHPFQLETALRSERDGEGRYVGLSPGG